MTTEEQALHAYQRGAAALTGGDFDQAQTALTEAISLRPDYAEAYLCRGFLYLDQDHYDSALADFNHALRYDGNLVAAYTGRGIVHLEQGRKEAAIEDFGKAVLAFHPDNPKAYLARGIAFFRKGEYQRALNDFNRSIELAPDHREAYWHRSQVYEAIGDLPHAHRDRDQAEELE